MKLPQNATQPYLSADRVAPGDTDVFSDDRAGALDVLLPILYTVPATEPQPTAAAI